MTDFMNRAWNEDEDVSDDIGPRERNSDGSLDIRPKESDHNQQRSEGQRTKDSNMHDRIR